MTADPYPLLWSGLLDGVYTLRVHLQLPASRSTAPWLLVLRVLDPHEQLVQVHALQSSYAARRPTALSKTQHRRLRVLLRRWGLLS